MTLSIGFLSVVLLWRQAEAERRHAEDELRFAGKILAEISFTGESSPEILVVPRDSIIQILLSARNHILHNQIQDSYTAISCDQLAQIDLILAKHFHRQKALEKTRTLLTECVENSDRVLERRRQDQAALLRRFDACTILGLVADEEGKSEESLGHLDRAVVHGEECLRLNPVSDVIQQLAECRWSLAQLLIRQGDNERARSLILANLRTLDGVPRSNGDPIIAIWRTLARVDLHFGGRQSGRAELDGTGSPVFDLKAQQH